MWFCPSGEAVTAAGYPYLPLLPEWMGHFCQSETTVTTLARGVGGAEGRLADETISEYLHTFHLLMVAEDLPAWNTHIRSRLKRDVEDVRNFQTLLDETTAMR